MSRLLKGISLPALGLLQYQNVQTPVKYTFYMLLDYFGPLEAKVSLWIASRNALLIHV